MSALTVVTYGGELEIEADAGLGLDKFESSTPAWQILELWDLWLSAPPKNLDLNVPHEDGERAVEQHRSALVVSLPMLIIGSHDHEGNEHPNALRGMRRNIEYLMNHVVTPYTRTAVLIDDDESKMGLVRVQQLVPGSRRTGDAWEAILLLKVFGGRLEDVDS